IVAIERPHGAADCDEAHEQSAYEKARRERRPGKEDGRHGPTHWTWGFFPEAHEGRAPANRGRARADVTKPSAPPPPGPPWDLPVSETPLAFVDLEMTGLDVEK